MAASAEEFIEISRLETRSLDRSITVQMIDNMTAMLFITGQSLAVFSSSKILLAFVLNKVDQANGPIDEEESLIDSLRVSQQELKNCYRNLGEFPKYLKFYNLIGYLFYRLNRRLIKKSFDNFGRIIVNIMEHDVDAENRYSGPFDSVDDLMKHLNS